MRVRVYGMSGGQDGAHQRSRQYDGCLRIADDNSDGNQVIELLLLLLRGRRRLHLLGPARLMNLCLRQSAAA